MEAICSGQTLNTLSGFIEKQRRLVPVCAVDNETANQMYAVLDEVDTAIRREIQILVVGHFASGKTTLLNALLGEEVLFTSISPSTTIPIELRYDAERRAIIYPQKGAWRGGDRPFEIALSAGELRKYCGWDQDDSGHSTESLFERAEIFFPNPILEQGVTFIELPATISDSACTHRRYKYDKYIRHADIVIYVMSATRPFLKYDCVCLEELRALLGPGLPIVFAVTFSDAVLPSEKQQLVDYMHKSALRYTPDLDTDMICFVDSRSALMAKKMNDHAQLAVSGMDKLEHNLLSELCHKKNCQKINNIIQQMEQVNKNLSTQIETLYSIDAPDDGRIGGAFRERSKELLGAQLQIELIGQELNDLSVHYE